MELFVFGDSHVAYFTGDRKKGETGGEYVSFSAGELHLNVMKLASTGPTMYGMANPDSRTGAGARAREAFEAGGVAHAVFVLGEVDCREHVCRRDDHRTAAEAAVSRFDGFVRGLPPVESLTLFGVCPPSRELVASRPGTGLHHAVATGNDVVSQYCTSQGHRFLRRELLEDDGTLVHLRPSFALPSVVGRLAEMFLR